MKPKMKQYAVWSNDDNDPDGSYWSTYDSLVDAVSEGGDGVDIYVMQAKKLGRYRRAVVVSRMPKKKAARKKKPAKKAKRRK